MGLHAAIFVLIQDLMKFVNFIVEDMSNAV